MRKTNENAMNRCACVREQKDGAGVYTMYYCCNKLQLFLVFHSSSLHSFVEISSNLISCIQTAIDAHWMHVERCIDSENTHTAHKLNVNFIFDFLNLETQQQCSSSINGWRLRPPQIENRIFVKHSRLQRAHLKQ